MRNQPNPANRQTPDDERNIGIIGTITLIAVVLVILVGAYVFNMPDRRADRLASNNTNSRTVTGSVTTGRDAAGNPSVSGQAATNNTDNTAASGDTATP
jgi:hypothetical protein